jgi:VIT1/CCC1 family predicted Fe2+/Mn2+ transporter
MSAFLNLNWKDFIKGLVVAVISAVITFVYETIQSGTLFQAGSLKAVGLVALTACLAYIIKNLLTNVQGELFKADPLKKK